MEAPEGTAAPAGSAGLQGDLHLDGGIAAGIEDFLAQTAAIVLMVSPCVWGLAFVAMWGAGRAARQFRAVAQIRTIYKSRRRPFRGQERDWWTCRQDGVKS